PTRPPPGGSTRCSWPGRGAMCSLCPRTARITSRPHMGAWDSELREETRPATPPPISWPLLETLPARLAAEREPAAWRELLRSAHEELKARFLASEPVEELVHSRAALVDTVLREAWSRHCAALPGWALVAVGGYGRAERHPCFDIDILLLAPRSPDPRGGGAIEAL